MSDWCNGRMTEQPATSPPRVGGDKYKHVETILSRSKDRAMRVTPLQYIEQRRGFDPGTGQEGNEPAAFAVIASELSQAIGFAVTHETIRRWYRAAHPHLSAIDQPPVIG